jgi:hypothetical protein
MDQHKPHGVLTQKTVVERCARMFKHNQWKQLYAFCLEEPRARGWAAQKRKEFPNLTLVDARVREFFEKVGAMPAPASTSSASLPVTAPPLDAAPAETPPADPAPAVVVGTELAAAAPPAPAAVTPLELVPPPPPNPALAAMFQPRTAPAPVITEEVDLASMEIRRPAPLPVEEGVSVEFTQDLAARTGPRLPPLVKQALRGGAVVEAAEVLLRQIAQTLPGDPVPVDAQGLEEIMAELAPKGRMDLVVSLLSKLPMHVTLGAMEDLGEKLRLGAVLQEPVQWFVDAIKETGDERGQPALQEILISSIRSALGEGED